jgi:hypothetical protein
MGGTGSAVGLARLAAENNSRVQRHLMMFALCMVKKKEERTKIREREKEKTAADSG